MMHRERLVSLDVMRGLTIAAMLVVNNPGSWSYVYAPLKHAQWNGLTPTDLIYPLFTFIMGVSMCFSLGKDDFRPSGSKVRKVLKRSVLLFLTGFALQCFSRLCSGTFEWASLRIMGVLQGLSIAYLLAAVTLLLTRGRFIIAVSAAVLSLYIILLHLGNGYEQSVSNIIARLDSAMLGERHLYSMPVPGGRIAFEPESILSSLPRAVEVLLGAFVGKVVLSGQSKETMVRDILLFGTPMIMLAFFLQYLDPINKNLWTSSFTLATAGAAAVTLALLIWVIDVKGKSRWCGFFKVYGANPLFLYVICWITAVLFGVNFEVAGATTSIKSFIYTDCLLPWTDAYLASLLYALFLMLLIWCIGLPLYKKKIFIKL